MAENTPFEQIFASPGQVQQNRASQRQAQATAFGQRLGSEVGTAGYSAGATLGDLIAGAFGLKTPEQQRAEDRYAVLQNTDIENPESLLVSAKVLLDAGDAEAAFAMASRAGSLTDRSLKRRRETAEAEGQEQENKLARDREVDARVGIEQILARSDFSEEKKNRIREAYLLAEVGKAKGGRGKPRVGQTPGAQDKKTVEDAMKARDLASGAFDSSNDFNDYRNTVASLAKAIIKSDDPITTDYSEAIEMVMDDLNNSGALINKATLSMFGDREYVLDKTVLNAVRARFGLGPGDTAPAEPASASSKDKPRRRITLNNPE